ncbi:PmoA family protein [Fodinibius sediminis]|uniref:Methane oxygenase PmoA n=1 Tax=Fodinibius sediminis TaxID=1214077 RepID=A0A521E516_9BACT|nr:PmoA family protein [Fodinibius sediminis]SMO79007.1 Methane oxygenase PmoA [Fodinibius sediminis]
MQLGKTVYSCLAVVLWLAVVANGLLAQDYNVTVSAGGFDRQETIVSFLFPDELAEGVYRMTSEGGTSVYLQVNNRNRGTFILDELAAGSSRTYRMSADPVATQGGEGVQFSIEPNTITFKDDDRRVLSYYHGTNEPPRELDERYKRGGYIHPVYSPGGTVLSNDLDTDMHPHHYGIWSAWTNTEFQGRTPDFWNVHDNTARIDHDSLEVAWQGPVYGGLKAKNHYVDLSSSAPVIALNEEWKMTIYDASEKGEYLLFDLDVTHSVNTAQPLVLPEYHYGGMAFRGHRNWDNPDNVTFLTSQGYGRIEANETRARWAHMGGMVDGKKAGIAVLSHPGNFRSPQPVRIHPETPYFVYAPMQLGRMSIVPGSPYVMRYRYVTYDGDPDPEQLNRMWNDYAYPPGVTVENK